VTSLARFLSDKGIKVVVVSAFDNRPIEPGRQLLPQIIAVPVRRPRAVFLDALVALKRRFVARTDSPSEPTNHLSSAVPSRRRPLRELYFRLVYFVDDYKEWSRRAAVVATRAAKVHGASVVFASGPPHSALVAGAWVARQLGIPFVADLRDPWSDHLAWAFPFRALEIALLRRLEQRVLDRAAAITSTGAMVAKLLCERNESFRSRVHLIRNGYDGPLNLSTGVTGGRLEILFAGELYVGRDPFPFLSALESLLSDPAIDPARVKVTFMGRVESYAGQSLARWVEGKRCARVVKILPPQPPEAVAAAAADSTVLLNLAQGQQLSVPAKTYEHLASGREILLLCEDDCETAQLVAGIPGVNQVDATNFSALTAMLRSLYDRHVRAGKLTSPAESDISRFSRQAANAAFLEVLQTVVSSAPV